MASAAADGRNLPSRPPPSARKSPNRPPGKAKAPPPPMDINKNNDNANNDNNNNNNNNNTNKTESKPGSRKGTEDRPKTAAEKAQERAHCREKALSELVSTEETFCRRVGLLITHYVKPLADYKIVTAEQHGILFPQLEVIKGLSDKFITELTKRRENWDPDSSKLSDLFEDFVPFFRMYQGYVNNHDKAVALMDKLQTKKNWNEFLAKARENCENQTLSSLLILPIQRIPRYKLLLTEVLKNSPETHPDYKGLSEALDKVQTVSTQINERMKEFDRRETVKQIERKFTTNVELLAPARQFIKQGKMWKVCRNKDRLYQFFLFNDQILYASSYGNKLNLHQQLPIDSQFEAKWLDNHPKYSNINGRAFQLISTKKSFVAYCDESKEAKEWFDKITDAIKEQKQKQESGVGSALQHKHTPSEAQAVWVPDSHYEKCTMDGCGNKFTILNRRHHCRRCGKLVCGSCSKYKLPNAEGVPQRSCKECYFKVNESVNQGVNGGAANGGGQQAHGMSAVVNAINAMNNDDNSDSDSDEFGEETLALHKVSFYVETEMPIEEMFSKFGHGVGSYVLVPTEQKEGDAYQAKLVVYTDKGYESHIIQLVAKKAGVQFRAQVGKKKKDFSDMNECVQWIAKKTKSTMVYAIPRAEVVAKTTGMGWNGGVSMENYDNYPKARALFDYEAEVLGDLTLRAGDIIIVLEKDMEGGWWTGRIGAREGLFPSNYAEMIEDKELPNANKSDEPKDGDILIARFDYNEGGKEELAFQQGDKIVLQAKDDTGWWLGKLQKSGVVGWFAPDLVIPIDQVDDMDDEKGNNNNNNNNNNSNGNSNNNNKKTPPTLNKSKSPKDSNNVTPKTRSPNGTTSDVSHNGSIAKKPKSPKSPSSPKASGGTSKIPAKKTPANHVIAGMGDPNKAIADAHVNELGEFFPLEDLKNKDNLPSGVNSKKLEVYLNDEEFESTFNMSRDDFYKMPVWKQRRQKKDVGLF